MEESEYTKALHRSFDEVVEQYVKTKEMYDFWRLVLLSIEYDTERLLDQVFGIDERNQDFKNPADRILTPSFDLRGAEALDKAEQDGILGE